MKRKSTRKKLPAKRAAAPKKKVQPIPAGYTAVTPYLAVRGAAQAIEFYQRAFGAKETMRMPGPGGMIGHAEVTIGGSYVMLADEYEPMGFLSPQARGCTTVHIHLYVRDVDASVARATAAGARVVRPVEDQFYGDRSGSVEDPFGHVWHIATRKVDLTKAELKKRAAEMAKGA
jgi:PhnB protein